MHRSREGNTAGVGSFALAVAIGLFIGLTPTYGIQMWLVTTTWLAARYLFRLSFDLLVSNSVVWISNPVTLVPLYYLFFRTGRGVRGLFGRAGIAVSYETFAGNLAAIFAESEAGPIGPVLRAGHFLLADIGFPIVLGSLVYAVPVSLLAYFSMRRVYGGDRRRKADKTQIITPTRR